MERRWRRGRRLIAEVLLERVRHPGRQRHLCKHRARVGLLCACRGGSSPYRSGPRAYLTPLLLDLEEEGAGTHASSNGKDGGITTQKGGWAALGVAAVLTMPVMLTTVADQAVFGESGSVGGCDGAAGTGAT